MKSLAAAFAVVFSRAGFAVSGNGDDHRIRMFPIAGEDQRRDLVGMALRAEHGHGRPVRPAQEGRLAGDARILRDPVERRGEILRRAIGRVPTARVPRRRAVAAQVERVDGVAARDERIHERTRLAGNLEIEVRERTPGPAVQQHDGALRFGGALLPKRKRRPSALTVCFTGAACARATEPAGERRSAAITTARIVCANG